MDYKRVLILNYINTIKSSYSYVELSELFGISLSQVDNVLLELENQGYLVLDKYYKLTNMGTNILSKYNLENIDFFDTMESEVSIFKNEKISLDEIYIPKNFDKKIK